MRTNRGDNPPPSVEPVADKVPNHGTRRNEEENRGNDWVDVFLELEPVLVKNLSRSNEDNLKG